MKIYQNQPGILWNAARSGMAFSRLQTIVMKTFQAQGQVKQTDFRQKKDALLLSSKASERQAAKTREGAISVTERQEPPLTISDEELPEFIARHLENYRDHIGDASDNLRFCRERISCLSQRVDEMQQIAEGTFTDTQMEEMERYAKRFSTEEEKALFREEYQQYLKNDARIRMEGYQKELDHTVASAKKSLDEQISMANGFVSFVDLAYGNKVYETLSDVMGDFLKETSASSFGEALQTDNANDLLSALDEASGCLAELANRVAKRYESYTGETLEQYQYDTLENLQEHAARSVENHIIFQWELGGSMDPRLKVAGAETVNMDFSGLAPARNLLDVTG